MNELVYKTPVTTVAKGARLQNAHVCLDMDPPYISCRFSQVDDKGNVIPGADFSIQVTPSTALLNLLTNECCTSGSTNAKSGTVTPIAVTPSK